MAVRVLHCTSRRRELSNFLRGIGRGYFWLHSCLAHTIFFIELQLCWSWRRSLLVVEWLICDVVVVNTCDHVYIKWYNNKVEGLIRCNEVSCLCCDRKLDPLFAHKLYVCGETKLASSSSHLGTRYSCRTGTSRSPKSQFSVVFPLLSYETPLCAG